jgi:hypothetical protein
MRVKFTNTLFHEVLFGTIIEMITPELFTIQADKGGRYIVNPNSDYNFGFVWNEEAEQSYAEALNRKVDELERLDRIANK